MAMPKIPALLLKVLLCGLLLCGCGGQPLSKREIVRAVFFAQQGEHYSVCLLLADQNAPEGESAFKTASAAAPTAGLHFTPQLMDTIRSRGVNIAEVTLHVGLGTFRPVNEESIEDHQMHSEWYSVSEETAQRIRETKAAGHRVIAVGTTSCRTLEAVAAKYGEIKACSGNTSIFLYPGVKFNCIDGLITNFHLPESTLIMLVSALYGYEKTMAAYKVAVEEKYRFFSFGDAMLIL